MRKEPSHYPYGRGLHRLRRYMTSNKHMACNSLLPWDAAREGHTMETVTGCTLCTWDAIPNVCEQQGVCEQDILYLPQEVCEQDTLYP